MVAKVLGLATGAGAAVIGLTVWSAVTTVTDDMRLDRMLTACLDFVTTGTAPFVGQGRAVGVYDGAGLVGEFTPQTHRIIDDDRFEVAWETRLDDTPPIRVCRAATRTSPNGPDVFAVSPDGFIAHITEHVSQTMPLIPDTATLDAGLQTISWHEPDKTSASGLRVVLSAAPGAVRFFLVAADLDP